MDMLVDVAGKTPLDPATFERAHRRTYARFVHLVRWFSLHAAVDLVGILCFIAGAVAFGFLFLIIGTTLLIWGIVTTRRAADRSVGEAGAGRVFPEQAAFLRGHDFHRTAA